MCTCIACASTEPALPAGGEYVENISLHSVYDTTKYTRDGDMRVCHRHVRLVVS
jgi:hypothetical protein